MLSSEFAGQREDGWKENEIRNGDSDMIDAIGGKRMKTKNPDDLACHDTSLLRLVSTDKVPQMPEISAACFAAQTDHGKATE